MRTGLNRSITGSAITLLTLWLAFQSSNVYCSGVEALIQRFATSDFVFQRTQSNAPFPPLAYLSTQRYRDSQINISGDDSFEFDQTSISQALVAPLLLTNRDALLVGEWLAWNRFEPQQDSFDNFEVTSIGLPLGWIRQVNPGLQTAAFIFPMVHYARLDQSKKSYENMAGAFARYIQTDTLWWGLGLFVDINPGDNLYLPYVGFSWAVSPRWTVSALMPWPALMYSPSSNTTFRFGASPSSTAWMVNADTGATYFEWAQWNLGLSIQQRVYRNFWLQAEMGVSGLRSLNVQQDHWQTPDIDSQHGTYLGLSFNWRPGAP